MKKSMRKPQGMQTRPHHRPANISSPPVPGSNQSQVPSCWVAEAWVDSDGCETTCEAHGAVGVFAVSVHEQYPADEHQRLRLLEEVAERLGSHVAPDHDSLWVYPGGYFGFDASAPRPFDHKAWPGFNVDVVRIRLLPVLKKYPTRARLAFGADNKGGDQQHVWVCWLGADGLLQIETITRHLCDLPGRKVRVGSLCAAFFVCGEFTGSHTTANGPYFNDHYLSDLAVQLNDCRLLIDLAHFRIKGNIGGGQPGPRQVHRRQMLRFAFHGASVLTHHHFGIQTDGRARNDCQSNWVIFCGGRQLAESRVHIVLGNARSVHNTRGPGAMM